MLAAVLQCDNNEYFFNLAQYIGMLSILVRGMTGIGTRTT